MIDDGTENASALIRVLLLTAACTVAPLNVPALFTFLLAWMLHIAVDRAAGYRLRGQDGFIRA